MEELLAQVRSCTRCASFLPLPPKPILQASSQARILIIGQAPGQKAHDSGIPWNDASGNRLRLWMNMDRDTFYDPTQVAIVPMGFCYPGKGSSGDLPPRPECAPYWHEAILRHLPHIELTLLIGQYAQRQYLPVQQSLTEAVRQAERFLPAYWPLPHPSPRNQFWLRRNPWFEEEMVPLLREKVAAILHS